ncbi:MAG TPA: hypothetical protein VKU01_01450 [Bryobacteraceae bacterium]|nr:hypothetical protein [Bryobacteraceae bacterium]
MAIPLPMADLFVEGLDLQAGEDQGPAEGLVEIELQQAEISLADSAGDTV